MSTERCNDEQEEQQKLESKENFKEKTNKLKKKSVHTTGWITLENTVRQKKQKLIYNSVYPKTY